MGSAWRVGWEKVGHDGHAPFIFVMFSNCAYAVEAAHTHTHTPTINQNAVAWKLRSLLLIWPKFGLVSSLIHGPVSAYNFA